MDTAGAPYFKATNFSILKLKFVAFALAYLLAAVAGRAGAAEGEGGEGGPVGALNQESANQSWRLSGIWAARVL